MNNGGPAFPALDARTTLSGMTLRDYFAAKAMQGLLAGTTTSDVEIITRDSYKVADAMLKAREK